MSEMKETTGHGPVGTMDRRAAMLRILRLAGISAGGGEIQPLAVTAVSDTPGLVPDPIVVYTSPAATALGQLPVA